MKRICKKCKVPKRLRDFPKDAHLKSGYRATCKLCFNAYGSALYDRTRSKHRKKGFDQQAYFKDRLQTRRTILDEVKTQTPCADCGRNFPAICMDFDHVRGEKAGNISMMWSCSLEKIEAEIKKCEVVCACCHRLRTQARQKAARVCS